MNFGFYGFCTGFATVGAVVVAILASDGQTVMMTLQQAATEATTASLDHETQQQLPSLDDDVET